MDTERPLLATGQRALTWVLRVLCLILHGRCGQYDFVLRPRPLFLLTVGLHPETAAAAPGPA